MSSSDIPKCSFCATPYYDVEALIPGKNAFICSSCIQISYDEMSQRKHLSSGLSTTLSWENIPTPKDIKNHLDTYIIGQDSAKKILSTSVYNHYKRILFQQKNPKNDIEIEKSNILIIGDSGTGKTLLAKTLAKFLNVPFAIADATTLTQAGYVGDDVENILLNLIQSAGDIDNPQSIKTAEIGIIFIDEIDKIGRKSESTSITRDVSGEGVQQALLKIIEGTVASVPSGGGRKHPQKNNLQINTKNILFICGGAFVDLQKILDARLNHSTIGFKTTAQESSSSKNIVLSHPIPDDLVQFGLIPELVGRLPIITTLAPLTQEDFIHILTKPKNALIKQYQILFELDGTDLRFEDTAIKHIAHLAFQRKTGARGLRSIMESILNPIMYSLPSDKKEKIIITKKLVENTF